MLYQTLDVNIELINFYKSFVCLVKKGEKMKSLLKKNQLIVFLYVKLKKFYYKYLLTDKQIIKKNFKQKLGRDVVLENPVKYNDKLQWLKLYWRDPLATLCADKYEVRKYVSETIGSEYLNELYDVYESVDEIELENLPNKFVLKGTHGAGYNIICEDKRSLNWKQEYKKMKRWLRSNYYYGNGEWVYKDIKPRIICEKYLDDGTGKPPMDYKVFCFNGEPKLIEVDIDRFGSHKRNFYDVNWQFKNVEIRVPSDKKVKIKKPKMLNEMLELSKRLSKNFPHARVDFYDVKGQIIFGEITFFHASGLGKFNPPEFEKEMGDWLKLPLKHIS